MSVKKVGDNKWDIYIRISRQRRFRKRVKASSKLEAILIEREIRKELGKTTREVFSVNGIAEKYLEWVEIHQAKSTAIIKKKMLFASILPHFGGFLPDMITRQSIETYKKKRVDAIGRKNRMINLEILCLQAMVKWAKEQGMCNDELPKSKPLPYRRPMPDVLTKEEVNAIINAMPQNRRALFLCLYNAGLRKDEATRLRVKDVNLESGYMRVHGKGNKERYVYLSDRLKEAMTVHLGSLGVISSDALIFPSRKTGLAIVDIRKPLETAMKKAGINKRVTPHMFRHAFATHSLDSGGDLSTIQNALGHQSISTTQIYLHASLARQKAMIEKTFK
jgi:site-specific recombinase XerD